LPTRVADITTLAAINGQVGTIATDAHVIKGVTLRDLDQSTDPMENYGIIGLMSGGQTAAHIISVFASGNFGANTPLFWTGSMPTESEQFIFCQLFAAGTDTFRLSAVLYKIVFQDGNVFRVDP